MQLFTPKKAKENFKAKQEADLVQIGYLKKVLTDLQNRINVESSKFDELQEIQRKLYSEEKSSLQAILRQLEAEIEVKRSERADLMIPIDDLKKRNEEELKKTEKELIEAEKRNENAEELQQLLTEKLDSLSDRETNVRQLEKELFVKKKGIDAEALMVSTSHEKLNNLIAQHNAKNTTVERKLADSVRLQRIKEENWRRYESNTKRSIAEKKLKIRDKEEMLKRGFEELKANQK